MTCVVFSDIDPRVGPPLFKYHSCWLQGMSQSHVQEYHFLVRLLL